MKVRTKEDCEHSEKSERSETSDNSGKNKKKVDPQEESSNPGSETLGEPAEDDLIYERDPPLLVGKLGVVKFGDSPVEGPVNSEGPSEVFLNEDYELPDPNSSRILVAEELAQPDTNGIIVATPLPFLGHFTSFDRSFRKPKPPPKVQSRWGIVKIPIRIKQDLPPKRPEPTKVIHPLESEWVTPGWVRPHVPIDPKNGRRILHHYPVTGDRKVND
ncbi:hypothetical protein Mapa_008439 [Marchantia paleacea]|nr:hypothetical protein Mapa_008439 [Marchantia paleacea]